MTPRRSGRLLAPVVVLVLAPSFVACGEGALSGRAAAAREVGTSSVATSSAVVPTSVVSTTVAAAAPAIPAGAPVGSPGCTAPSVEGVTARTLRIDTASGPRRSLLSTPATVRSDPPVPAPLVIDLHGYTESAEGHSALDALATRGAAAGMVVATPQALGRLTLWNATEVGGLPDDVAFIASLVDRLLATMCIDTTRVAVVGGSNGAFMASTVGCRLAGSVTSIAAVAGLLLPDDCAPAAPVSVLAFHGLDDHLVPVDGGLGPERSKLVLDSASRAVFDRLPVVTVPDAAAGWAWLAGCQGTPARSSPLPLVRRTSWDRCAGEAEVRLDLVEGGRHSWFGSEALREWGARDGDPAMAEDATGEMLAFVRAHPRAAVG